MAPQQQQLPQQPLRVGREQETREQGLVRLLLQAEETLRATQEAFENYNVATRKLLFKKKIHLIFQ